MVGNIGIFFFLSNDHRSKQQFRAISLTFLFNLYFLTNELSFLYEIFFILILNHCNCGTILHSAIICFHYAMNDVNQVKDKSPSKMTIPMQQVLVHLNSVHRFWYRHKSNIQKLYHQISIISITKQFTLYWTFYRWFFMH